MSFLQERFPPPVEITINNTITKSKDYMNVLRVNCDSKLNWSKHVANQISKSNRALHAIKMIKKYFTQSELLSLLTSNYYSILFYNSEIWHIPNLKPQIKQLSLSASANLRSKQPKEHQIRTNHSLMYTSHVKELPRTK